VNIGNHSLSSELSRVLQQVSIFSGLECEAHNAVIHNKKLKTKLKILISHYKLIIFGIFVLLQQLFSCYFYFFRTILKCTNPTLHHFCTSRPFRHSCANENPYSSVIAGCKMFVFKVLNFKPQTFNFNLFYEKWFLQWGKYIERRGRNDKVSNDKKLKTYLYPKSQAMSFLKYATPLNTTITSPLSSVTTTS
jgi:hypothetical protein